jgi:amino acid transporter
LRIDNVSTLTMIASAIQLITLVVFVGCLLTVAPSLNSAEYVFFDYNNDTGFTSQAYVLVISLVASSYSFSLYDGSGHMAEESINSRVNAPLGLIYSVLISGVTGFAAIFALLFAMQSLSGAISNDYNNAAIAIIVQAAPYAMQVAICWLLTISVFVSGIPMVTTCGRITYALLRDKIIPGLDFLAAVEPTTQSPIYAIMVACLASCLLLLLPLVNEAAFYSFCSICGFGSYVSYAVPIGLKLFSPTRSSFPHGPINFGKWTIVMEIVSMIFLAYQAIILLLPYTYPVTAANMNYSVVIIGGLCLLAHVAWIYFNQYTFKGPKRIATSTDPTRRHEATEQPTATSGAESTAEEREHLLGRNATGGRKEQ